MYTPEAFVNIAYDQTLNVYSFAVISSDGTSKEEEQLEVKEGTLADGINHLLAGLVKKYENDYLMIYTSNPSSYTILTEQVDNKLWAVETSERSANHVWREIAREHTNKKLDEYKANLITQLGEITVAVDGSYSRRNKTGGAGILADNGIWAAKSLEKVNSPLETELAAIKLALRKTPPYVPLTILVDSWDAIHTVTKNRTPAGCAVVATQIQNLLKNRDVTFQKVKGHNGNYLNEGADNLAVAARRNLDAQITNETTKNELYTRIAKEHLENRISDTSKQRIIKINRTQLQNNTHDNRY